MRERRKGYWELAVDAGRDPSSGRRRRVVRAFRGTKREAQRALNELLVSVDGGQTTASTATLEQLLHGWLENVGPSLSPTTLAGYRRLVDGYIVPTLGRVKLHQLTAAHLDGYYRSLSRGGLRPASVRQFHAVISSALNQGVKWDWVGTNVAARATPPPVRRAKLDPPSPVRRHPSHRGCETLSLAGARRVLPPRGGARELGAASSSRCDGPPSISSPPKCVIEHSVVQVGRELFEKDTKTHQARRLSLDPGTVDVLARFKTHAEDRLAAFGMPLPDNAFVFSDEPDGSRPWNPERITRAFSRFCVQEGITGVRFHDLRHFVGNASAVGRGRRPHRVGPPGPRQRRDDARRLRPLLAVLGPGGGGHPRRADPAVADAAPVDADAEVAPPVSLVRRRCGDLTVWVFSDESERGSTMLLGLLFVPVGGVQDGRRALQALLLPGQRRIHTSDESARRRRQLLDVVGALDATGLVLTLRRPSSLTRVAAPRRVGRGWRARSGRSTGCDMGPRRPASCSGLPGPPDHRRRPAAL